MSIFSHIRAKRPQSSDFNLSHTRKMSFNPGDAVPSLCQEVLPSDRWNVRSSALVRLQPMLSPIMHMVDMYNYSFFVPMRLTMERNKFEVFITGGPKGDGKDAQGNTVELPYIVINRQAGNVNSAVSLSYVQPFTVGFGLLDYLGAQSAEGAIVQDPTATFRINATPLIAFWRVFCEYFRDENLYPDYVSLYPGIFESTGNITEAVYDAVFNPATPVEEQWPGFFYLPRVSWEKDYFTSALPFAQRGNPVETPLTGTASVTYKPTSTVKRLDGGSIAVGGDVLYGTTPDPDEGEILLGAAPARVENIDEVELETGGFTINQLRLAVRLQEWLEKMARGGARYIEQIRSHFGVTSSDARLQRPEFLGGGRIPVNISEVLQTGEDGVTPLADMAGHGVAAGNVNGFSRFFEEHGFVISIAFVRPRTAYQQGIPRLWTQRFDKLDWAWPSFAHLGEQAVRNDELYADFSADDLETFGYQSRYAEYKYIPSTVHGLFRTSLNFWHWGRIFNDRPTLSKPFVECDPDPRIFNLTDDNYDRMYCIINNRITARRPLPYYGTPTT